MKISLGQVEFIGTNFELGYLEVYIILFNFSKSNFHPSSESQSMILGEHYPKDFIGLIWIDCSVIVVNFVMYYFGVTVDSKSTGFVDFRFKMSSNFKHSNNFDSIINLFSPKKPKGSFTINLIIDYWLKILGNSREWIFTVNFDYFVDC